MIMEAKEEVKTRSGMFLLSLHDVDEPGPFLSKSRPTSTLRIDIDIAIGPPTAAASEVETLQQGLREPQARAPEDHTTRIVPDPAETAKTEETVETEEAVEAEPAAWQHCHMTK